jgi:beta-lactamase class A
VSFGVVTGRAAPGATRVVVTVHGRVLVSKPLRHRRFSLHVDLPLGDVSVRVTTIAAGGRRSSRVVSEVYGLPAAGRPRNTAAREDAILSRELRGLIRSYRGVASVYVQDLTTGRGAAWNAKARFPAASTLKLAIAATVLAVHTGLPSRGSRVDSLLRAMLTYSDNASANALEVWLAGSTSAGSHRVDALMRSLGMVDSLMYGGYETRAVSDAIPSQVDEQPAFGIGKYTSAADLSSLLRAVWLAAGGRGPLPSAQPGFTPVDGRYLLWLLAHVRDTSKLDGIVGDEQGVTVLHKAGWISTVRHDAGLVFWPGGVFVATVMTWNPQGDGISADRLAARCAAKALARFRRRHR